jgi:hypothetical protein
MTFRMPVVVPSYNNASFMGGAPQARGDIKEDIISSGSSPGWAD